MWSYDFDRIDPTESKTALVVQAINYGTLAHWRWLVKSYGREGVREFSAMSPQPRCAPELAG